MLRSGVQVQFTINIDGSTTMAFTPSEAAGAPNVLGLTWWDADGWEYGRAYQAVYTPVLPGASQALANTDWCGLGNVAC
jgi:hypothetical protein